MGDSHTGIDYWLSIPVKELSVWLELMDEHYQEQKKMLSRK